MAGATKISPRSCRLKIALPVALPARSDTSDPVWQRVGRGDEYVPLTAADVERMVGEFVANGRSALIAR